MENRLRKTFVLFAILIHFAAYALGAYVVFNPKSERLEKVGDILGEFFGEEKEVIVTASVIQSLDDLEIIYPTEDSKITERRPTLVWKRTYNEEASYYEIYLEEGFPMQEYFLRDREENILAKVQGAESESYIVQSDLKLGNYTWQIAAFSDSGVKTAVSNIVKFSIISPGPQLELEKTLISLLPIAVPAVLLVAFGAILLLEGGVNYFSGVIGVFIGYIFRKKKHYWGIIYDKYTGEPIPFAVIRLYKAENNQFVKYTVSDLAGRFAFLLDSPGLYTMEVKTNNYETFMEQIKINDIRREIVEDVPLIQKRKAKTMFGLSLYYVKTKFLLYFKRLLMLSMFFGLLYSIYAMIENPHIVNYTIFLVYVIMTLINLWLMLRSIKLMIGRVVDEGTGKGLAGAVVRLYVGSDTQILAATNNLGEIKANLRKGEYNGRVIKEGFVVDKQDKKGFTKININKGGFLFEDIRLINSGISDKGPVVKTQDVTSSPF